MSSPGGRQVLNRRRRKGRKRRRAGAQPKMDKQTNQPFAEKAADEFD